MKPISYKGVRKMSVFSRPKLTIQSPPDAVLRVTISEGDRVVLPFNIACGFCFNCHRGHTEACLTMNPEELHAAYGYVCAVLG
jgi:hypothetical protein